MTTISNKCIKFDSANCHQRLIFSRMNVVENRYRWWSRQPGPLVLVYGEHSIPWSSSEGTDAENPLKQFASNFFKKIVMQFLRSPFTLQGVLNNNFLLKKNFNVFLLGLSYIIENVSAADACGVILEEGFSRYRVCLSHTRRSTTLLLLAVRNRRV